MKIRSEKRILVDAERKTRKAVVVIGTRPEKHLKPLISIPCTW